ncbi:MAG TPA: glycine--tRNA ligase subunit beta [Flexistipes sinusarabici]|uniref:Glycine--tRNA ligase beta subunit n=1 Tax=Flexistipes sinusarabici TaxID=2352 RepID=A0A3D5QAT0_FLESI|nr:glycine--tRNA ligase subunit beta [Flexistipes sinusarabici]
MSYYLLEIGTEELPASFINPAAESLKESFSNLLTNKGIGFGDIQTGGTPRRLYLYIDNLNEKQDDKEEEIMGPPANIAFDENGGLTKAGKGFAKSKSLDEKYLKRVKTDKGEYLAGKRFFKGVRTDEFLQENVASLIKSIPFQKSMRWSDKNLKFARPVHWVISVYNGNILDIELDGIKCSDITYGHRFMSEGGVRVKDFDSYCKKLLENNVVYDFDSRKKLIKDQLKRIQEENNDLIVQIDEELLDSVANLVEKPFAVLGSFSEDFLELPDEVLITSMKNHQKYFYATDKNGKMSNYFIGVSNTKPKDDTIRYGYEKVLKARLSDAVFFFENDKKILLENRVEQLRDVVYQEKLGTSYEKMERFYKIASYLSGQLASDRIENTQRVAYLCKGDLMTEMIYEFPELQGIMGREYARVQGENDVICKGIYEHYLPRFAGDDLPETKEGCFVSIADKIDTICGCFAIGLVPTGNNDPYALRRNAIGILNIIRNKNFRLSLKRLIDYSLEVLSEKISFDSKEVSEQIYDFILLRLKNILHEEGIPGDVFDAVKGYDDIVCLQSAAEAIARVKDGEDFEVIATSYKRISNILKKAGWQRKDYDISLFQSDFESKLDAAIKEKEGRINVLINNEEYKSAMDELLGLRLVVDDFFDNVMVMDKDEKIKNNRLSLLNSLKSVFDIAADLSKVKNA